MISKKERSERLKESTLKRRAEMKKMREAIMLPPISATTHKITFDFVPLHNPYSVQRYLREWNSDLKDPEDVKGYDAVERLIRRIRETDDHLYAEYPSCEKSCIGVSYSGGYDSTLLVANAAEKGEIVVPLIVGVNNDITAMWVMAELNLLELRRKYPNSICKPVTPVRLDYAGSEDFYGYRLQPSIAYSLAFIGDVLRKNLKEIQVGFICKDECISFLDEFVGLYKAANKFIYPYEEPPVPLTFPLKKLVKSEIVRQLKDKHILKFPMSTCEQPSGIVLGNGHGMLVYLAPCSGDECCCNSCRALHHIPNRAHHFDSALLATFGDDEFPIMDTIAEAIEQKFHIDKANDPVESLLNDEATPEKEVKQDVKRRTH